MPNVTVSYQTGRYTAWLSALLIEVGAFVSIMVYFNVTGKGYPDPPSDTGPLDPLYLNKLWQYRRAVFPSLLAVGFFMTCSLLLLTHSITCVKKIYRTTAGGSRHIMSYC